jgi:hypothetical protein
LRHTGSQRVGLEVRGHPADVPDEDRAVDQPGGTQVAADDLPDEVGRRLHSGRHATGTGRESLAQVHDPGPGRWQSERSAEQPECESVVVVPQHPLEREPTLDGERRLAERGAEPRADEQSVEVHPGRKPEPGERAVRVLGEGCQDADVRGAPR